MNMKKLENRLVLGAQKPLKLLHFSDTHLALADDRDDLRKRELAEHRARYFPTAEQDLRDAAALARQDGALLVHTGDLIDFVSYANLERAKAFTDENDCFFSAGNHEFSLYVGEAFEDAAYRNQSLDRVQAAFKNPIRFASRKVNGINLVALDDSYYRIEEEQLAALRREAELGLPIVLLMHNPLHEQPLYDVMMHEKRQGCAYLTGTPEPLMGDYPPDRLVQQRPDEVTREAVEYICAEPCIRAILAGHLHFDYEGMVAGRIPQLVTGIGSAREITIE